MKSPQTLKYKFLIIVLLVPFLVQNCSSPGSDPTAKFGYTISIPEKPVNSYSVEFNIDGLDRDTIILKIPKWMPGYYQIMGYSSDIKNIEASDGAGKDIPVVRSGDNSWKIPGGKGRPISINYEVETGRQFVATSYIDSAHAYILPANTFLYVDGQLDCPASIKIENGPRWSSIVTGLDSVAGTDNEFTAKDYDHLYDCPILAGNLVELPRFEVEGIEHRFVAYNPGDFDHVTFIDNLQKVVASAINIIGDIPYDRYQFIGIGPGRGGIEHLNNTTISFDGSGLGSTVAMNRILAFIAHEYFHHFNVKRIRPYELGPFDYDKENRTNQLWVSEGLTVYYEYLILSRAGLIDENTLFDFLEGDINTFENDPGKKYQSLVQSSYYTWEDGPFGARPGEADRSISYYNKGAIVGLLLDLEIRDVTQNTRSLDDVMRRLYYEFYIDKKRGFTEAEFQGTCEAVAGVELNGIFEYVYTTKEFDYNRYLSKAGLQLQHSSKSPAGRDNYSIVRLPVLSQLQESVLTSWQRE